MRRHSPVLLRLASAPGLGRIESVRTLMSTVSLHGGQAGDTQGDQVSRTFIVFGSDRRPSAIYQAQSCLEISFLLNMTSSILSSSRTAFIKWRLTSDCVQAGQRLSVFSSPHLTLDADSARVLAELTAAFYF